MISINVDSLFEFFNEKYQNLLVSKLVNEDKSNVTKENFISTCQIASTLLIETYKKCIKKKGSDEKTVVYQYILLYIYILYTTQLKIINYYNLFYF